MLFDCLAQGVFGLSLGPKSAFGALIADPDTIFLNPAGEK
jgi:hypothetical protein